MSDYELSKALEVVKGRVYYIAVRAHPRPRPDCHFFCIDDTLVYWNFFLDFGPLNLGQTYRFCTILHTLLTSKEYQNLRIYYYSSTDPHKRTNAAWLVSAYRMMYMGLTPEQVRQLGAVTAGWRWLSLTLRELAMCRHSSRLSAPRHRFLSSMMHPLSCAPTTCPSWTACAA